MLGFVFAILSGAAMSIQGVFNTRLSDKVGLCESNLFVQGTAFVLSLLIMLIFGKGDLRQLTAVNKLYWLGGVLGVVITMTVMLSITNLHPTVAISTILIAQLIVAALIDGFGLFDTEKAAFHWTQLAGIALMIGGVVLFKLKT